VNEPVGLEPELHGLLAELAERPERARFLRKDIGFRELLTPEPLGLGWSLGGDALERHLLRAQREELALLLLQASQWKLRSTKRRLLCPRDASGRVITVDVGRWKRRADHQRRVEGMMDDGHAAMGLLRGVLDPGATGGPTARELAVASLRLVPRTEALMCAATTAGYEGDRGQARAMYRRALEGCPSDFLAGLIFQDLAALACAEGRHHEVVEWSRRAALSSPDPQRAAIAWFAGALQAGQASELRSAAACLRESVAGDSEQLAEYVGLMRKDRAAGEWSPTRSATLWVRYHRQSLPSAAEKILEAFR
jgi:hypothetical protein